MACFEAFSTEVGGSHLKHCGSGPAILTAMMDDRVPSSAKLFLVLVLFRPTSQRLHLNEGALKLRQLLEMLESLSNWLKPVTFEKRNQGPLLLKCFAFIISINYVYTMWCQIFLTLLLVEDILPQNSSTLKVVGSWGMGISMS